MSRNSVAALKATAKQAQIFAALGDTTRLTLVKKLIDRDSHSISDLSTGTKITRQAVTKHLTVLEGVGLVSRAKKGRESLYSLDPEPLRTLQDYLAVIAAQWDEALNRLKSQLEEGEG